MLYYGRYARNGGFILGLSLSSNSLFILRYLETGKSRYLVLLTIATILQLLRSKEDCLYIYTHRPYCSWQFIWSTASPRAHWKHGTARNFFIIVLSIGVLLAVAAVGITAYGRAQVEINPSQTSAHHHPRTGFWICLPPMLVNFLPFQ